MERAILPPRVAAVLAPPGTAVCGARIVKTGQRCKRPAGYGTDHVGRGSCRFHGGRLGPHRFGKAVANAELCLLLEEPVDMDPGQALLWCVALTAQELHWINDRIAGVTEPSHMTMFGEQLDMWIKERQKATERLAKYAKMALDAGVAERMVSLAEKMGDLIAPLLKGVLEDLKLTPAQKRRAPDIIGRRLRVLEAGPQPERSAA